MNTGARLAVRLLLMAAVIGLVALSPASAPGPGHVAQAGAPPVNTTPPTIDGLLDSSYLYDGRIAAPDTPGKLFHYYADDYCYYAIVVDRAFNDNVFGPYDGLTQDGWRSHSFKHLEKSDSALFAGAVAGCTFNLDYLDRTGTPKQWCSGTCGDAYQMTPAGCAAVDAATSMYYNTTQSLYGRTHYDPLNTNTDSWVSPALDYNCTNEYDDYYEWDMIYEFRIAKSGSCSPLEVSSSHNSPSKDNQNQGILARLGNYVWYDGDRNGIQDEVGGGMRSVCMSLKQAGPDGLLGTPDDVVVATTQTDSQGEYWFNYLQPGTYYVDPGGVCIPDGYCHSLNLGEIENDRGSMNDPPGTDPGLCDGGSFALAGPYATTLAAGDPYPITLVAGQVYPYADFGYDADPTAVFLQSFGVTPSAAGNLVLWETASEVENLGFYLYRAPAEAGERSKLNEMLIAGGMPPGSAVGASYEFLDQAVVAGAAYYYWLEALDIHGQSRIFGPVAVTAAGPALHVGPIGTAQALIRGSRMVMAVAEIVDAGGGAAAGAAVSGRWTLPSGATVEQKAPSTAAGLVSFRLTTAETGIVQFCVTNVAKEGYGYDAGSNLETCDLLLVR